MGQTLTIVQCQKMLFDIGIKIGVSPKLISTRLLSNEDKQDMLSGLLPVDCLVIGVRTWLAAGMPDYANGKFDPYKAFDDKPMSRYRGMGKR